VLPSSCIAIQRYLTTSKIQFDQHQISENVKPEAGALSTGQKVKQAGKDASYMGIMLLGFGVTGTLIWYVVDELMFGFSANSVYSKALKLVKDDDRIQYEIGDNLKGYGEETSRGRRRHVTCQEFVVDGVNHMRVRFYLSGTNRKATVHCEAVETSRGKFDFRYIFVEMQGFPPSEPIIVVDNR